MNSSLTASFNAKSGLLSTNVDHDDHDAVAINKCYGTFDSTAAGNEIVKNDSHVRWSVNKDTKGESKSLIISKTNVSLTSLLHSVQCHSQCIRIVHKCLGPLSCFTCSLLVELIRFILAGYP